MLSKILNVILCFLFIQWGLQFVKLSSDSNLLDMFFVSGIFILSLILFYEHHIKKPTLEFINWLYPEFNLLNIIDNDNLSIEKEEDIPITPVDIILEENNVIENLNNEVTNENKEENEEKTIEIEMEEINI